MGWGDLKSCLVIQRKKFNDTMEHMYLMKL